MTDLPPIVISTLDRDRLYALLERHQEDIEVVEHLYDELDRAECRPSEEMPEDVVALHSRKGRTPKAPAKYANPEDPTQTWSGRGRKPIWVHESLEAGKSLETFEIK